MLRPGDEPIRGYRLEAFLGQGQFGQVWKTTSPGGGTAALKFLDLTGKEGRKELRGIQRVKAIRHAHLVPITALWILDDDGIILHDDELLRLTPDTVPNATLSPNDLASRPRWLVVAQVLAEKTLRDELNHYQEQGQTGIPVTELLTYMEEAAKGIDYLNQGKHDLGDGLFAVQHCDIKPANMLLVGGSVMVCDFGLAHILVQDHASRSTGIPGSPAFVAPECIDQRPSSTTDQYSLAISYYELRTGNLPFADQTPLGAMDAHRTGNLDFSDLPSAEAAVVAKAASLKPEKRYESCSEFVKALKEATGIVSQSSAPPAHNYAWLLPGITTAILIAALLGVLFWPRPSDNDEHRFRIVLQPTDARVRIDGEEVIAENGMIDLTRPTASVLNIVVSKGMEYETHSDRVTVQDYTIDGPLTITLDRSAYYLATEAEKLWASGEKARAVQQLGQAMKKDQRFAVFPKPDLLTPSESTGAGHITQFAIAREQPFVFASNSRGNILRWATTDMPKLSSGSQHHQHDAIVETLEIRGEWVASADSQRNVYIASASDPSDVSQFTLETEGPIRLDLTDDGNTVFTANSDQLLRWQRDGTSFTPIPLGTHGEVIEAVRLLGDKHVVTGSWDGEVRQWNAVESTPHKLLGKIDGEILAVEIHGTRVAFAGHEEGGSNSVFLSDTIQSSTVKFPEVQSSPIGVLQFSPGGQLLAAGTDDDGRVTIWRETTPDRWERLPVPNLHQNSITALRFAADGLLLSGSNDGTVALWDLSASETRSAVIATGFSAVANMRLTPDGRWLIVLSTDGKLLYIDVGRCRLIKQAADSVGLPAQTADEGTSGVEA